MLILLIGHGMEAEMDVKATVESKGSARWWRAAWAVCALVVVLQMTQQYFSLGLTMRLPIEAKRLVKENDVYEWRLPHRYRNPLMVHRAVLVENGWPLQRAERVTSFMDRKNGWFNVYRDLARFFPVDGSDPRTNGKKYEMIVPKQYEGRELWVPWVILIFLSFMVSRSGARGDLLPEPKGEYAWVYAVALIIAVLRVWSAGLYSDGVFAVGGQPESDAGGWYQHGQGLAEGWGVTTGFSGQRPFYGVLISPLFLLPGDPMIWIKGLHCLLWAAGAAGLYALGRILSGRAVGVACALALMAGETHMLHVLAVLTENPGLALAILAALALWRAFRDESLWMVGACGLLMGFGNLAAGATLFAIPALPFVIVAYAWKRWGLKQAVIWSGVFTVAVSALFLPWMIRQKLVLGIFTPSTNSGTLLRGGADPVHKRMWPGIHEEAFDKAGIARDDEAAQYKYHMGIFKQTVAEDPVRYIKQVGEAWVACFEYYRVTDPGFRIAGLLLLAGIGLGAVWRRGDLAGLLMAMLLAAGWTLLEKEMILSLVVAAVLICFWTFRKDMRLWLAIILLCNLGAGTILAGMAGNQTAGRLWQNMDWILFLFVFTALYRIWVTGSDLLGRLIRTGERDTASITLEPAFVGRRLINAAVAVCVGTGVFAVGRTIIGPKTIETVSITEAVQKEVLARVAKDHPDEAIRTATNLTVTPVRLTHRRYLQPAGYDTAHWMSHYGRRSYDRWVLFPDRATVATSPDKRGFGPTQGRGDISKFSADEPLLWVSEPQDNFMGLTGNTYQSHNGVAVIPLNKDGTPDWSRALYMERCTK